MSNIRNGMDAGALTGAKWIKRNAEKYKEKIKQMTR